MQVCPKKLRKIRREARLRSWLEVLKYSFQRRGLINRLDIQRTLTQRIQDHYLILSDGYQSTRDLDSRKWPKRRVNTSRVPKEMRQ
jgi:hypothetical protein